MGHVRQSLDSVLAMLLSDCFNPSAVRRAGIAHALVELIDRDLSNLEDLRRVPLQSYGRGQSVTVEPL